MSSVPSSGPGECAQLVWRRVSLLHSVVVQRTDNCTFPWCWTAWQLMQVTADLSSRAFHVGFTKEDCSIPQRAHLLKHTASASHSVKHVNEADWMYSSAGGVDSEGLRLKVWSTSSHSGTHTNACQELFSKSHWCFNNSDYYSGIKPQKCNVSWSCLMVENGQMAYNRSI